MKTSIKVVLGNEAIATGALAAGVSVAAAYPGTPSTEILESIAKYGKGVYTEWSSNEKVAFETAYGAAMVGARAMASMKHVGVNVASDSVSSSSYTGVEGSLVLVSADDPSMWSSQNEQDNRYFGLQYLIPVVEPYDPQSAHLLTLRSFQLSDSLKHPVMLRTNTRVSHVRAPVEILPPAEPVKGKLMKDPHRYVLAPENARRDRKEQLKRWERAKSMVEELNEIEGEGRTLVIASGIGYPYVKEALEDLHLRAAILKLSTPVPIPRRLILKALESADVVALVEELDPVVEMQLKSIMFEEDVRVKFFGKDLLGREGELTLDRTRRFLGKVFNVDVPEVPSLEVAVPPRPPAMCSGCPHRSSFIDLKKGLTSAGLGKSFISGDIGCYTLGVLPPFDSMDSGTDMGSSLGLANGVYRATGEVDVAVIGDSTFFHSGLSALANAVYNNLPVMVVVLDNRSTAMTGQQPSPSKEIDIAGVARSLGVEYVKVIDPFDTSNSVKVFTEAAKWVKTNNKPAVVVAKRACALDAMDNVEGKPPVALVELTKCTGCSICYDFFTCPAIIPREDKKALIDPDECIGCGACVPVCPFKAIRIEGDEPMGWREAWLG
jgi:indolepyruvate ferredoxin oxidoreductase alpha subunit